MTNPPDNQSSPDPEFENTAAFVATQKPKQAVTEEVPFKTKLKHFMLKVIDITALRLFGASGSFSYGEEPNVQLRKIGKFIVVPVVVFAIFLAVWGVLAPTMKTKSGEVPTPSVVWQAGVNSLVMHDREQAKAEGYLYRRQAPKHSPPPRNAKAEVDGELAKAREDLETAVLILKKPSPPNSVRLMKNIMNCGRNNATTARMAKPHSPLRPMALPKVTAQPANNYIEKIEEYGPSIVKREEWKAAKAERDDLEGNVSDEVITLRANVSNLADEKLFLNALHLHAWRR